jgi:hypothetical protein
MGVSLVMSISKATAVVAITAFDPVSAALAMTIPPAMTSPAVTGTSLTRTVRCHEASSRFHMRWATKYIAHGGPKVATALAIAPGMPHTFHQHHQDHVRSRDRMRQRKEVGELPIRHPRMHKDDKVADIRQNTGKAAEADRRKQDDVCRKGNRSGRIAHWLFAALNSARTILTDVVPSRTTSSGSFARAKPMMAPPATIHACERLR